VDCSWPSSHVKARLTRFGRRRYGGAAVEGPALTGPPAESTEAVIRVMDSAQVGSSRLLRTPNGINFSFSTTDLTPGHAYTLWFVAFNEPAQCLVPNVCVGDDVVNDAAKPDMMYATGRVAGGAGTPNFSGRMNVGDTSDSINRPVGLPSYGLMDPFQAQIILAVHDHGPKLPEYLPDMIQTIDGGCTDAGIPAAGAMSPWNAHPFGRRGPNTCATTQISIHRP
jgi:hypothetical protein